VGGGLTPPVPAVAEEAEVAEDGKVGGCLGAVGGMEGRERRRWRRMVRVMRMVRERGRHQRCQIAWMGGRRDILRCSGRGLCALFSAKKCYVG
jgi:hypothetical protein